MKIRELLILVESECQDPEGTIAQVYSWRHGRMRSLATWCFGISASLLAIFVTILIDPDKAALTWKPIVSVSLAILVFLSVGVLVLRREAKLKGQLITAVAMLGRARRIQGFLKQYAQSKRGTI